MIQSGIYAILNLLNGKRYIGSAVNLRERWKDHFCKLERGIHKNFHLQNAFSKYGRTAFAPIILEYVENIQLLLSREDIYLKMFWSTGLLYNVCPVAGSTLGYVHTEKTRYKCSRARLKLWADEEYRQMMLEANRSAETRQKRSKAAVKRWEDPEQREKASKVASKRWEDPEYRRMMFDANPMRGLKGEQHPGYGSQRDAETRRKMSVAKKGELNPNYGKPLEDEHRENISKGLKRHWADPERAASHRHAISTALKKYWARRRQDQAAVP